MGLRTIVLKLHKPSKAKQEIMDEALLKYNTALRFLLDKAYPALPEFEEKYVTKGGQYNMLAMSKWIDSDLSCELNKFGVQPFKDSLRLDFASAVANCLRLRSMRNMSGFPGLGAGTDASDKDCQPLYFCRYDTKRSYCLLYDGQRDRYYAKLYLMNGANARPVQDQSACRETLVHIHKDSRKLEKSGRKEAFIIVPLAFGKWQEEIIKEAVKDPASFKTARLLKKKGEFYLAVSIETGSEENIKTSTFMGISRGLKNKLNYTVVDNKGEILAAGPVIINHVYKDSGKIPANELHETANTIVNIAVKHKARVIVQNLCERTDGLIWTENGEEGCGPEYRRKDYNRLTRLLDYKLVWRNLPQPVKVSSVDIFHTCLNCGMRSKRNRLSKDFFICTECGTAMDIDKLGSLNLARKLINYKASKVKIKISKVDEGVVFKNRVLGLECFSSFRENQLERLENELQRIVESIEAEAMMSIEKSQTARFGLISKLKRTENFMDMIEYN